MKKRAKKKAKGRAPKKLTITERTKTRMVVENPKRRAKKKRAKKRAIVCVPVAPKKKRAAKKRARPKKKRATTITVRNGARWFERVLSSPLGRKHRNDRMRATLSKDWLRQPTARRDATVHQLMRGNAKQKRAAIAIAKAEAAKADGPPRKSNPAMCDATATAEYERTHWGQRGKGRIARATAADPRHGTSTALGELVAVVYRTKKGRDRELTDYEHEFEGKRPELVYNDGGLIIAGGDYTIEEGGIDG
jgi:hypothetical protein